MEDSNESNRHTEDGRHRRYLMCRSSGCLPGGVLSHSPKLPRVEWRGPKWTSHSGTEWELLRDDSEWGTNGGGTVFQITPTGKITTLYNFCSQANCTDGEKPEASLVQTADGNLYGTTFSGGAHCVSTGGCGTLFEITAAGQLTTLYSFCSQPNCTDGTGPTAAPIQGLSGSFYGTTYGGGANCVSTGGCGTVFEITPAGALTTLYSFCSQPNCTDGKEPAGGLVQARSGSFYGTTSYGGASCSSDTNCGTVFEITPAGELTTLYSFCSQPNCSDGDFPWAGLVQASNGNFLGTTVNGGSSDFGTVFEITPAGRLTTLFSFGYIDGAYPYAGLMQATNGDFYGTTYYGSANGSGSIFEITPEGQLATIYSFCSQINCTDGEAPSAGLLQATNGSFYGVTSEGGTGGNNGTVFSLSVGLGPFVAIRPGAGKVGSPVVILGNDLTGSTGVSFNGAAAALTVVSSTEIVATVPSGATTGYVQVTTFSSWTLTSNVKFRVLP